MMSSDRWATALSMLANDAGTSERASGPAPSRRYLSSKLTEVPAALDLEETILSMLDSSNALGSAKIAEAIGASRGRVRAELSRMRSRGLVIKAAKSIGWLRS